MDLSVEVQDVTVVHDAVVDPDGCLLRPAQDIGERPLPQARSS